MGGIKEQKNLPFFIREITRTYVRKKNWSKNEIILLVFIIVNVATKEGEKLSEFVIII